MPLEMYDIPIGAIYFRSIDTFDKTSNLIDLGINYPTVISHQRKTELSALPQVIITNFRNGDVESAFCSLNNLPEDLAFSFERAIAVKIEVNPTDSNYHKRLFQITPVSEQPPRKYTPQ